MRSINSHISLALTTCVGVALAISASGVFAGTWSTSQADGDIDLEKTADFGLNAIPNNRDYTKGRFTRSRTKSTAKLWAGVYDQFSGNGSSSETATGEAKGSLKLTRSWLSCPGDAAKAGSYSITIVGAGSAKSFGQYSTAFGLLSTASNSGRATSSGGGTGSGVGTPNTALLNDIGADDADTAGALTVKGTKVPDQASNGVEATIASLTGQTSDWGHAGNWVIAITPETPTNRPAGTTSVEAQSLHSCGGLATVSAKGDVGASTSAVQTEAVAESTCSFSTWTDAP